MKMMTVPEQKIGNGELVWLVKSGDRILGPFSVDAIEARLGSRDLVAIDEVCSPGGRWHYLRDEPRFAKALETLRNSTFNQREDTEINGVADASAVTADFDERTASGADVEPLKIPERPAFFSLASVLPLATKAIGKDAGSAVASNGARPASLPKSGPSAPRAGAESGTKASNAGAGSEASVPPSPGFGGSGGSPGSLAGSARGASGAPGSERRSSGSQADAYPANAVSASARRSTLAIWVVTLALLGFGAFALLRQQSRSSGVANEDSQQELSQSVKNGMLAYRLGHFEEAAHRLSDAESAKPDDPEVEIRLAALLAHAEQGSLAKRKAEPFLAHAVPEVRARALIAHAAGAVVEGEYGPAAAELEEALKLQPGDLTAQINLGVIAVKQRNLASAIERFRQAASAQTAQTAQNAAASTLLGRALILAGQPEQIKEGVDILRANTLRTWDFKQEGHFLLAQRSFAEGDRPQALAQLAATLSADPFATESHWHDPAMALAPISWSQELLPLCRSMAEESNDAAYRALLVICLQKAGQVANAPAAAADLIQRFPSEALSHAVSAFVALSQNDDAAAEASLKIALDRAVATNNEAARSLAQGLKGRLCWKKRDLACAAKAFESTGPSEPRSIFWPAVQAQIEVEGGRPPNRFLDMIRPSSPNFIPLLEIESGVEPKR
jgi:tetratricopeptide (TPR) repeat protein